MNKTIYLGTTFKCSACKLQEQLLKQAIEERNDIELIVCDYNELPSFIQTNVLLEDFPVSVFIEDEIIKYTIIGTMTVKKIKQLMSNIEF